MRYLLIGCFICYSLQTQAQKFEPTSVSLTVLDGLASNNVYCAMQDSQGYIWFGTETGVSRYNGRSFENFYMSDGLADNEIFRIDEDSQGRIWFSALNGKLSYYQHDKFYNGKTSPGLASVSPKYFYLNFFEDSYGNVWMNTKREVILIHKSGEIKYFGKEWFKANSVTGFIEDDHNVWGVSINTGQLIELASDNAISDSLKTHPIEDLDNIAGTYLLGRNTHLSGAGGKTEWGYLENKYSTTVIMGSSITKVHSNPDGTKWLCTYKGVIKIASEGKSQRFFEDDIVTHVLTDHEGGFWFTFLGKGIAYVPSLKNKSMRLAKNTSSDYVSTLMKDGETIWFGGSEGQIGRIQGDQVQVNHLFETAQRSMVKRIIKGVRPGELWVAAETRLVRTQGLTPLNQASTSAKVITRWGPDKYALGLSGYLMVMSESQLYHDMNVGKSSRGRDDGFESKKGDELHFDTNAGFVFDIENYQKGLLVSTSLGLFFMDEQYNHQPVIGPDVINERVNDIMVINENDYALATHGYGIYLWQKGSWTHVSKQDGLNSDICRKVIAGGDGVFWVATNKGVNRVSLINGNTQIAGLTKADGLLSEEVFDLVISGNQLMAATSDGISIIDIADWERSKEQPLMLEVSLLVSDKPVTGQAPSLKHNVSDIRFEFDGLHFKSLDRLSFQYRLAGQNDDWKTTKLNAVNVGSLAAGDYVFEVRAVSAFGNVSPISAISFSVKLAFWKSWWFITLMALLFIGLVLCVAYWFVLSNKRKSARELEFKLRLADAERKALQSQLNPHFIFNSLNSIQCMVLEKDPVQAYEYLEKFSKLIRRVLRFSDLSMITLSEELQTLRLYMDLERVRLENQFDYFINLDEQIGADEFIPSMVLQPYVENAIWHGIMPLEGQRSGKIVIDISKNDQVLYIEVTDNGVGRGEDANSPGFGIKLADQLANTFLGPKAGSVRIEDLFEGTKACGTRVCLEILNSAMA